MCAESIELVKLCNFLDTERESGMGEWWNCGSQRDRLEWRRGGIKRSL